MIRAAWFFTILVVLLSFTVGSALAANGLLTLIEVRNDAGGGVILVFHVSGEFSRNELRLGTIHVQGEDGDYNIHCSLVSDDLLQCTTTQAVAGKNVVVNLAGFIFWTYVPPRGGSQGSSQYCYDVYDLNEGEQGLYWLAFDIYCQDSPASDGQPLNNFPDPWGGTSNYRFEDGGPDICVLGSSDSAYYGICIT